MMMIFLKATELQVLMMTPLPRATALHLQKGITSTKAAKARREAQEDALLQKAISCMEAATNKNVNEKDDDDIFAQFIASE